MSAFHNFENICRVLLVRSLDKLWLTVALLRCDLRKAKQAICHRKLVDGIAE